MSHWVLLVAPLVLASFVMLFAFVGCFVDSIGTGTTYEDEVLANQFLVAYWRLGEAAGATTAVDSKGDHDGTFTGGVTLGQPGLVVGAPDTAAQFDGSTGYVSVPFAEGLNKDRFTVEAVVEVAGGADEFRAVVSSRDIGADTATFGYILYASDQNKWEAWVGTGAPPPWGSVSGPDVTSGRHYLAMTYDGTTLKLYVDPGEGGEPVMVDVTYAPNATRELRIGAGANEATPLYFFNGVIDEVAVYNEALDVATIRSHHALVLEEGASP